MKGRLPFLLRVSKCFTKSAKYSFKQEDITDFYKIQTKT